MKIILTSQDGFELTRLSGHMRQHLDVLPLLHEAVRRVDFSPHEDMVRAEVDFGRVIGASAKVATAPGDDVYFARRVGRDTLTRFVRGREAEPTSVLSFIASKRNRTLVTAYFGTLAPREPDDVFESEAARQAAVEFWARHALVHGSQKVRS